LGTNNIIRRFILGRLYSKTSNPAYYYSCSNTHRDFYFHADEDTNRGSNANSK